MTIYINTNQNVNIRYEISSLGNRILAYVIDGAVIFGVSLVLIFIFGAISISFENPVFIIFVAIPAFFYHLICEVTMNGQSIGKRITKIKVMKTDGTAASFSNYFLRFLLRPIDSIYFLGLVCIFFTKKGQRLGDIAAGTVIVNLKEDVSLSELKNSMHTSKSEVTYVEVDRLKDKDIEVVKRVLNNWKAQPMHENVVLLSKKIQDLLEVEITTTPYKFLETIVHDYHTIYA